jgi:dTDP-4-amino-4,6-dideoxygalactose transaminase
VAEGLLDVTPPLPPRAFYSRRVSLPFPYGEDRCRLYDRGRHALWHGLGALGLGEGDELLVPAYHCGSEVGALVDRGIVPRFWGGTEALEPDPEELQRLIGPRTRGLYLIHYLGLAQDGARWRRWCDERGLLLLEDAAPSWLAGSAGRPVGYWGDLAIFSPWKLVGVPEAGALLCQPPPPPLPLSSRLSLTTIAKGAARSLAQRSRRAAEAMARREEPPFDPEREYAIDDPNLGMSKLSLDLLRRLYRPDLPAIRRRNYEWLRERVGERVPVPFDRELREDCPLYLPVTSADKAGLRAHLLERGIRSVDFWSVPHPVAPAGAFPAIDRRREITVLLPIHQELRPADLERIAAAVAAWPADP